MLDPYGVSRAAISRASRPDPLDAHVERLLQSRFSSGLLRRKIGVGDAVNRFYRFGEADVANVAAALVVVSGIAGIGERRGHNRKPEI